VQREPVDVHRRFEQLGRDVDGQHVHRVVALDHLAETVDHHGRIGHVST